MSISDIIYESKRLQGRAEGYKNAADSIEKIVAEHNGVYALRRALRELVQEMREQAQEDES